MNLLVSKTIEILQSNYSESEIQKKKKQNLKCRI